MKLRIATLLVFSAFLSTGMAATAQAADVAPATQASQAINPTGQQLRSLVDEYYHASVALNPLSAPDMGVYTYNDQFGDYLSDAWIARAKNLEQSYLNKVQQIDRASLSADDRITYDMFRYDREMALRGFDFPFWYLPLNHFDSKASTFADQGTGEGSVQFATVRDYEDFLKKMDGFAAWSHAAVARMREGMVKGVALPIPLADILQKQLRGYVTVKVEDSSFWKPIANMPKDISPADRERLTAAYRDKIEHVVNPAYTQMADFLQHDYKGTKTLGYTSLPNGKAWYQYKSDLNTTTNLPVAQIHEMGKKEVARILREMNQMKAESGYKGDLKSFWKYLQTDPKFFWTDPNQELADYKAFRDKIYPRLPLFFNLMPKAPYEVRPVPKETEDTAGVAYYNPGTPDGSRPGIFYVNTKPGQQLPKWSMETLAIHEAAPGHHFQISLKQEQQNEPEYRKFASYNAFEEGWAVYCESIGREMGMEKDPLQYFGKLNEEMLRAMRLVVDTGLHSKGWSIKQAEQYMHNNSALGAGDIHSEVRRYLAIPGQALSYKVGQLTFTKLRADSKAALGDKFDIRAFHDQVLSTGSLPMSVMQTKIQDWIASQKQ
ncbi:DUF885 domain-containing protein [Paludibacterium sp. THUN1379]|uniref:DUF885 domain-containing protein n=1 Tax=Paludibacterium sp. THUN1379 TaxID=3112107 RepID=UPI003093A0F7|nr:DUF885 domain-containing protein [Paludibacterium sp. THUN1379]